jgi:hypothetical protein
MIGYCLQLTDRGRCAETATLLIGSRHRHRLDRHKSKSNGGGHERQVPRTQQSLLARRSIRGLLPGPLARRPGPLASAIRMRPELDDEPADQAAERAIWHKNLPRRKTSTEMDHVPRERRPLRRRAPQGGENSHLRERPMASSRKISERVMIAIEKARTDHRPRQITTLFVAESPPVGGTFFYYGNGHLGRHVRRSIEEVL